MAKQLLFNEWTGSSQVSVATYDTAHEDLFVVYKTGAIYQYYGVAQEVWDEMQKAKSVGVFLNQNVKGKFPFKSIV